MFFFNIYIYIYINLFGNNATLLYYFKKANPHCFINLSSLTICAGGYLLSSTLVQLFCPHPNIVATKSFFLRLAMLEREKMTKYSCLALKLAF